MREQRLYTGHGHRVEAEVRQRDEAMVVGAGKLGAPYGVAAAAWTEEEDQLRCGFCGSGDGWVETLGL